MIKDALASLASLQNKFLGIDPKWKPRLFISYCKYPRVMRVETFPSPGVKPDKLTHLSTFESILILQFEISNLDSI